MRYIFLFIYIAVISGTSGAQNNYADFIDDNELIAQMTKKASELFNDPNYPSAQDLSEQLADFKKHKITLSNNVANNITDLKKGVLTIFKLYLCDDCPRLHPITATAMVLNTEGYCASNYHVFKFDSKKNKGVIAVCAFDSDGHIYPIERVVASDKKADLAVFKIKARHQLHPIKIGNDANLGDEIQLFSHPDKMFYTYTKGIITRNFKHQVNNTPLQSISADFAKGSSGAPVFNRKNEICGIVASTRSIYVRDEYMLQMVVKEMMPVSLLKSLCQ